MTLDEIKALVRTVPDFPKEGILFRDITPVLRHPEALRSVVEHLVGFCRGEEVDAVVGIESRGFMFGVPLALALNAGFVPVRKLGKLPAEVVQAEYALEYGTNTVEMHRDALKPGDRVVIVDDLIATGGTAGAAVDLVEQLGGEVVALLFFVELTDLNGRECLQGYRVESLVSF
ncbi:MAG: adenine phosphoribosyltransferase [Armatimonadota bacterium]|nr:adenine phosphoribosyltransferase [Armatimonadota bacterium]